MHLSPLYVCIPPNVEGWIYLHCNHSGCGPIKETMRVIWLTPRYHIGSSRLVFRIRIRGLSWYLHPDRGKTTYIDAKSQSTSSPPARRSSLYRFIHTPPKYIVSLPHHTSYYVRCSCTPILYARFLRAPRIGYVLGIHTSMRRKVWHCD
jgi:hypothetical protein